MFWDIVSQTNRPVQATRLNLVIINNQRKLCYKLYVAVIVDNRVRLNMKS